MKVMITSAMIGSMIFSGAAFAAGDPEAGKAKAVVCAVCHGQDGIAVIDGYPNLKGQNEKYLISSLKAYKSKERSGGLAVLMQPQASVLSDQDIENVAAYYSSMK